jgi:hypothetical protein
VLIGQKSTKFKYEPHLSYEENRGQFLRNYRQYIGTLFEQLISKYDPDTNSKWLGTGGIVDGKNTKFCWECKLSPSTDNHASHKANIQKGKQFAAEHDLEFVYFYLEDRRKNQVIKDGVLHLHGSAIFEFLECVETWPTFLEEINAATPVIINELRDQFDREFKSYR